jgi:hypothetical protein
MICQTSPVGMIGIVATRENVAVPPSTLAVTTDCGSTITVVGSVATIVATP